MKAVVALGSNLGDRGSTLRAALTGLGRLPGTRLLRASPLRETAPEAPGDGGAYLNAAALLETSLPPGPLLRALLALEGRHGRPRQRLTRCARTLDLDLVLYGALRVSLPDLEVPHPRFRGRSFVLGPAAQVAPRLVDPGTGHDLATLHRQLS